MKLYTQLQDENPVRILAGQKIVHSWMYVGAQKKPIFVLILIFIIYSGSRIIGLPRVFIKCALLCSSSTFSDFNCHCQQNLNVRKNCGKRWPEFGRVSVDANVYCVLGILCFDEKH